MPKKSMKTAKSKSSKLTKQVKKTKPAKTNLSQVKNSVPVVELPKAELPKMEVKKPTVGEEIWANIAYRELGMFGLANQRIVDYCAFMPIEPSKCYLTYKVSSVIPQIEAVVPEYDLEVMNKYIVLSLKRTF
jgi:hypothetical protein